MTKSELEIAKDKPFSDEKSLQNNAFKKSVSGKDELNREIELRDNLIKIEEENKENRTITLDYIRYLKQHKKILIKGVKLGELSEKKRELEFLEKIRNKNHDLKLDNLIGIQIKDLRLAIKKIEGEKENGNTKRIKN